MQLGKDFKFTGMKFISLFVCFMLFVNLVVAQQIDSIVKAGNGKKIIVSADNTHVTKATGKMGSFLKKWYGDKYIAFGFTYNLGTYSAYGPEKIYEVYPSYTGTYEYFFSKSKFKNFYLDLRKLHSIALLENVAGFRSIGSRPQLTTQFSLIDIKKHFDAIVYLEYSNHTSPFGTVIRKHK